MTGITEGWKAEMPESYNVNSEGKPVMVCSADDTEEVCIRANAEVSARDALILELRIANARLREQKQEEIYYKGHPDCKVGSAVEASGG